MAKRVRRRPAMLRAIKLNELSLVNSPANPHAVVTLFKCADDATRKDYDECAPSPVQVVEEIQALSFDEVLAEDRAREAASRVRYNIWEQWHALQRSFETIAGDDEVEPATKITQMQESLRQFISSLSEESKTISEAVTKSISAVPALAALLTKAGTSEGDVPMTDAEKKALADLQKQVESLTKKLEAATSASEDAKKAADLQDQLEEVTAKAAALETEIEEAKKAAEVKDEELVKAKMSDDEKSYMEGLDKEAKSKFMSMSSDERRKAMKKALDADEVLEVDGRMIRKSAVGDDMFEHLKAQQVAMDDLRKKADDNAEEIKKAKEAADRSRLEKRASDDFDKLPGEVSLKARVLGAIEKIEDDEVREAAEKILETAQKVMSAAFDNAGVTGEELKDLRKRASEFEKHVDDIKTAEKCKGTEAMAKARERYPEAYEAYQEFGKQNN